eukprot:c23933_g2_i1 orf=909-2075(+)
MPEEMARDEDKLEEELKELEKSSLSVMKHDTQGILSSLLYGDGEARLRAAKDIRKLTKTSANSRSYFAAAGVIAPLVSMLKSGSPDGQEVAVLALLNLAVRNERNKVRIVKEGAIAPLVELLQSEDAALRESAAAAVLTLSASNANKPVIGASGATPLLVEMLMSGSIQGRVDAVMALYNISTFPDNLEQILNAEAVPPLLLLLQDCKKYSRVAEKTTALLESLSTFEEGRSSILKEEGGILALVEVLEEGSLQGREHAVRTLFTMCKSSRCKYRQAILQEGVIPGLLELTVQGTPRAQQDAHNLLQLLRDSPVSTRSTLVSASLESIVYDIASHVDCGKPGSEAAKMLTEMAQLGMEQSMRHLQDRTLVCIPSDLSRSSHLTEVPSK